MTDRTKHDAKLLVNLLAHYDDQRKERRAERREQQDEAGDAPLVPQFLKAGDLSNIPPLHSVDHALGMLERDPVRFALRAAAREIGWRAYARGGPDEMRAVFDAFEEMDGRIPHVLDKWWDRIGGGDGVWLS